MQKIETLPKLSKNLLSIGADYKTVKGEEFGYLTGILYFAPAKVSGFQVCPLAATANCEQACLYTAGRGGFNSVQVARVNKTLNFFGNRHAFMMQLVKNIRSLKRKALKKGLIPLVRLNGTSDIRWETVELTIDGITYRNIMEYFSDVQFYDYTKDANRSDLPINYDLTFSYSGVDRYQKFVDIAKAKQMRIAVVFRTEAEIPETFLGLPVVSGDTSDIRHIDPQNSIVALYAKGKAKTDTTGFVVDMSKKVIPIRAI